MLVGNKISSHSEVVRAQDFHVCGPWFALQVALIAIRMTKIPTFQTNIKFKCKALRTETGDCRHLMKKIKFKYMVHRECQFNHK